MTSKFLKSAVTLLVLVSALVVSTATSAAIKVELKIEAGELKVASNPSSCSGNADDPCIVVGKGKTPNIIFKLTDACEAGADKPKHKLDFIRITQVDKVWPTPNNPLNESVAKDFKADPATGMIQFGGSTNNKKTKKKLKFKNGNSHAYSVFYEIVAVPCDSDSDEDDLHLDPEIRNRGRN